MVNIIFKKSHIHAWKPELKNIARHCLQVTGLEVLRIYPLYIMEPWRPPFLEVKIDYVILPKLKKILFIDNVEY